MKKIETTPAIVLGVIVVALAAVALLGASGVQASAMGALGAIVLAFMRSILGSKDDDDDRTPPPPPPTLPTGPMTFALAFLLVMGCGATLEKPKDYEAELIACNALATTLDESIACENEVRAKYRRPLRDAGSRPVDGGAK